MQGIAGKGIHGGTTISGTMVLAHLAGIKIFGTGGLGKRSYREVPTVASC
jgi:pseudouridine-5'-phosphate glycosidase